MDPMAKGIFSSDSEKQKCPNVDTM